MSVLGQYFIKEPGELYMARRAFIDASLCDGRADCLVRGLCPTGSFLREEDGEPWSIGPACSGCGRCLLACDRKAISLL